MKNLAPDIFRKRLVVEGFYNVNITGNFVKKFLIDLCKKINMTPLTDPILFDDVHGVGAYMAWTESGVGMYTWERRRFFTLDIYTCKDFNIEEIINFIKEYLKVDVMEFEEFKYD